MTTTPTPGEVIVLCTISMVMAFGLVFAIGELTNGSLECGTFAFIPFCGVSYESQNVTVERTCYQNGERINCSEIERYYREGRPN